MSNSIVYVKFRGDLSFRESPFNDVDALVLSSIVGLDLNGLIEEPSTVETVAGKLAERIESEPDHKLDEKEELFMAMAAGKRFKDLYLENFVEDVDPEKEKTFYALTVRLSRFKNAVIFRGTDGSLLSWKENFNTICMLPTAGQEAARDYLKGALAKPFVKTMVIGHSKGANLALFAAMETEEKLQKKISDVYVFDGPGFIEDVSDRPGYKAVEARIRAFVPESCVIGNLMEPGYPKTVVRTSVEGIVAHDMFNWEVLRDGFDTCESTNEFSRTFSDRVNGWIYSIPVEERRTVVSELFGVFEKHGIAHLDDLMHLDLIKVVGMIMSASRLSSENKTFLTIIFKELKINKQ